MIRALSILVALTVLFAMASQGLAENRWCSGYPDSIFCDDFDRDCVVAQQPPPPEVCPEESDKGDPQLRGLWKYTSFIVQSGESCGTNMAVEDITTVLPTHPFGGRHANGGDEAQPLGQNTVDLQPFIATAMPTSTVVNGSDGHPLVLTFTMGAGALGAMQFNNGYMELGLGDPSRWNPVTEPAKAVTDWIMTGTRDQAGCFDCALSCPEGQTAAHNPWPTICQQEFPHPSCPPKMTNVRNVLAVGALAFLDNNPCHCCPSVMWPPGCDGLATPRPGYACACAPEYRTPELPDGWQEPTSWHLAYFDGVEWRMLKAGVGGPGSYGDFRYGNYWIYIVNKCHQLVGNTDSAWETVVMTVKTSTVDIKHITKNVNLVDGQWVETEVVSMAYDLPRRYTGAFNRLRAGTDEGCQLIRKDASNYNNAYECDVLYGDKYGKRRCKINNEYICGSGGNAHFRSSAVSFDNVKLSGGIGDVEVGACCRSDASCVETDTYTCETILGGRFQGRGVTCQQTACCPYPFADADHDGDVDQNDFGAFQACYNGSGTMPSGCQCLDRNADSKIDSLDLTSFINCVTEANVPWAQLLTPNCTP